jgi:hypothetical protein
MRHSTYSRVMFAKGNALPFTNNVLAIAMVDRVFHEFTQGTVSICKDLDLLAQHIIDTNLKGATGADKFCFNLVY